MYHQDHLMFFASAGFPIKRTRACPLMIMHVVPSQSILFVQSIFAAIVSANTIPTFISDKATGTGRTSSLGQSHASANGRSLAVSSTTISYFVYVVILGMCLRFKPHWMFQIYE